MILGYFWLVVTFLLPRLHADGNMKNCSHERFFIVVFEVYFLDFVKR